MLREIGYPRFIDIPEIRRLAATPFVEMAITTIIDQIAAVEWKIIPKDEDKFNEDNIDKVTAFFENPNINKESFSAQLRKILRDILTLDSGVWVKVFDKGGRLRELYPRDAGTFTKSPDIFGTFAGKDEIIQPAFLNIFNRDDLWTRTGIPRPVTDITTGQTLDEIAKQAAYFQYGWITGARPMPFGTREIIYMMRNPRTDSIYGRSVVEICLDTVQMLVYGIDHNLDYYTDNNIAKGVFQMVGAGQEEVEEFGKKWKEITRMKNEVGDYRRRFHHMPIINKDGKFVKVGFSNAELELISQQEWFSKVLWANFGVTSSELGFTADSNRATEIVQSRVFRRKAIIPLLTLLEYHINKEIMPEFENGVWINAGEKDEKLIKGISDVKFSFDMEDLVEDLQRHELFEVQIKNKIRTPNEIREELGLEPIEGGDEFQSFNPFNRFGQNPNNEEREEENQREKPEKTPDKEEEKNIETKPFGKYSSFADCVKQNQAKRDPDAYCSTIMRKVEGKFFQEGAEKERLNRSISTPKAITTSQPIILKPFEEIGGPRIEDALKKLLKDSEKKIKKLIEKNKTEKTLETIKDLSQPLIRQISELIDLEAADPVVKATLLNAFNSGLETAELELNMNFLQPDKSTSTFIATHAAENVKDLSEEIKNDIRAELERGLMAGESVPKLKARITKIFDKGEVRAEMIARTEVNRAENFGILDGYKQSGLKGQKEWVSHLDDRTSDECRRLHGRKVDIDANFHDGDWEAPGPPRLPNCRSRIVFIPE